MNTTNSERKRIKARKRIVYRVKERKSELRSREESVQIYIYPWPCVTGSAKSAMMNALAGINPQCTSPLYPSTFPLLYRHLYFTLVRLTLFYLTHSLIHIHTCAYFALQTPRQVCCSIIILPLLCFMMKLCLVLYLKLQRMRKFYIIHICTLIFTHTGKEEHTSFVISSLHYT